MILTLFLLYWLFAAIIVGAVESFRDKRTWNHKVSLILFLCVLSFIIAPLYLFEKEK